MKKTLQLFLFLLLSHNAFAQTHSVKGQIIDAESGETIIGVNVSLVADSQLVKVVFIANEQGTFTFEDVKNNHYQLEVSYVGYTPYVQDFEMKGSDIDLGEIKLKEGINLPEVQVTERIINIEIIGDTTQINAAAYKVLSDASTRDLIQKMPGIEIIDGVIYAQGEVVKEILVDGIPFFRNNPNATVQNLPAEMVDKVQIYEREVTFGAVSAAAEDTEKVMNLALKKDKKTSDFGRMYGGYGNDKRYQAASTVSMFKKKRRITLTGSSNNIDKSDFLGGDEVGKGGRGIVTKHSAAINYSDNSIKDLEIYANYALGQGKETEIELLNRRFFNDDFEESYEEQTNANDKWLEHRFSGEIKYKMNERNSFNLLLIQKYSDNSNSTFFSGKTISDGSILSQTFTDIERKGSVRSGNTIFNWTHKFTQKGHGITTSLSVPRNVRQANKLFASENIFGGADLDTMLIQQTEISDNNGRNVYFMINYYRPVGKNGKLNVKYNFRQVLNETDRETLDFNSQTDKYDFYNRDLSNVFESNYLLHELTPEYKHTLGKWTYVAKVRLQKVKFINRQSIPEVADFTQENLRYLPTIIMKYKPGKGKTASITYSSSTQEPSLRQLQNVINNSNPLQLKIGNPDLRQSVSHRVKTSWRTANSDEGKSLAWRASYSIVNNYLGRRTQFVREEGVFLNGKELATGTQLTQYVNLDGNWNANTSFLYSFPFDLVKSNMSISMSGGMNQRPTIINETLNFSQSKTAGMRLTLNSNISERIDVNLFSTSSYNVVGNTARPDRNTRFFKQKTDFRFNCIIGEGVVFRTNLEHFYYGNSGEGFDPNYLIWNMNIGKKVFKSQLGEINLAVFDIFNQNNSLSREISDVYLEDRQRNVLQRYLLLSFKYELRVYKD